MRKLVLKYDGLWSCLWSLPVSSTAYNFKHYEVFKKNHAPSNSAVEPPLIFKSFKKISFKTVKKNPLLKRVQV